MISCLKRIFCSRSKRSNQQTVGDQSLKFRMDMVLPLVARIAEEDGQGRVEQQDAVAARTEEDIAIVIQVPQPTRRDVDEQVDAQQVQANIQRRGTQIFQNTNIQDAMGNRDGMIDTLPGMVSEFTTPPRPKKLRARSVCLTDAEQEDVERANAARRYTAGRRDKKSEVESVPLLIQELRARSQRRPSTPRENQEHDRVPRPAARARHREMEMSSEENRGYSSPSKTPRGPVRYLSAQLSSIASTPPLSADSASELNGSPKTTPFSSFMTEEPWENPNTVLFMMKDRNRERNRTICLGQKRISPSSLRV